MSETIFAIGPIFSKDSKGDMDWKPKMPSLFHGVGPPVKQKVLLLYYYPEISYLKYTIFKKD